MLPGRSSAVSTVATPGMRRAGPTSTARMRAEGCAARRARPHNMPSAQRSPLKENSPRTFGPPSGRVALSPMPPRGGATVMTGASPVIVIGARAHGVDRREHAAVARATAEVAAHRLTHLQRRRVGLPLEQVPHGHDEPRRAEPALDRPLVDEGRLQVGELAPFGILHALEGDDLRSGQGCGEHEAGADQLPVHQHRARPALPLLAAGLGRGQPEPLAEDVEQALPEPCAVDRVVGAVDREREAAVAHVVRVSGISPGPLPRCGDRAGSSS